MRTARWRVVALLSCVVAAAAALSPIRAQEPPDRGRPHAGTVFGAAAARPDDPALRRARETLTDLLASEAIDRIDFEATTYDEAMARIRLAVDTVLEASLEEVGDPDTCADQSAAVIRALNGRKPRGLALTFGPGADKIAVRSDAEARMLGRLIATTASIIRQDFGDTAVSYQDRAEKLFRSVHVDVEEGTVLEQYMEDIQAIADTPTEGRARYFR